MNSQTTLAIVVLLAATTSCCTAQTTIDVDIQIVTDNLLVNTLINPLLKTVVNLLNNTLNILTPGQSQLAATLENILQTIENAVSSPGTLRQRLQALVSAVQNAIQQITTILNDGSLGADLRLLLQGLLAALNALLAALASVLLLLLFGK